MKSFGFKHIAGKAILPALVLAMLAAPATASALDICVNAPQCPPGAIDKGGDLKAAINLARLDVGDDTILLGSNGSSYSGPFIYQPGASGGPLHLVAVGATRPLLTSPVTGTVLNLEEGDVSGVDVLVGPGDARAGLSLVDANAVGVTVTGGSAGATGGAGIVTNGQVDIEKSRVDLKGEKGIVANGQLFLGFSTIQGPELGLDTVGPETVQISRSKVVGRTGAVSAEGFLIADTSVLETTDRFGTGVRMADGFVSLSRTTVAATTAQGSVLPAIELEADAEDASAELLHAALAGYARGVDGEAAGGVGLELTARSSAWDSSHDTVPLGPGSTDVFPVEPTFVDLVGGDLRPRVGSSAIDPGGDPHPGELDFEGNAPVDGDGNGSALVDAGAFEYLRRAPQIAGLQVPATVAAAAPFALAATVTDADADPVSVRWSFGDGTVAEGLSVSHVFSTQGAHLVTVTAKDASGVTTSRELAIVATAAAAAVAPSAAPAAVQQVRQRRAHRRHKKHHRRHHHRSTNRKGK